MKMQFTARTVLLGALLASGSAYACGEGGFNMGQGLRYQGYLAPRPATVLIYSTEGESTEYRDALAKGLRESGHTVTAVAGVDAMSAALRTQHYDVVIAKYENVDMVANGVQSAGAGSPAVLPVVERSMRKDPGLNARFANFVLSSASLGQYLKSINKALPVAAQ